MDEADKKAKRTQILHISQAGQLVTPSMQVVGFVVKVRCGWALIIDSTSFIKNAYSIL